MWKITLNPEHFFSSSLQVVLTSNWLKLVKNCFIRLVQVEGKGKCNDFPTSLLKQLLVFCVVWLTQPLWIEINIKKTTVEWQACGFKCPLDGDLTTSMKKQLILWSTYSTGEKKKTTSCLINPCHSLCQTRLPTLVVSLSRLHFRTLIMTFHHVAWETIS